jgi:hypothetical protein
MWQKKSSLALVIFVAFSTSGCSTNILSRVQKKETREVSVLVKSQRHLLESTLSQSEFPGAIVAKGRIYPGNDFLDALDRRQVELGSGVDAFTEISEPAGYIVFAYRNSIPRVPDIIPVNKAQDDLKNLLETRHKIHDLNAKIEDARSILIDGMKLSMVTQLQISELQMQESDLQKELTKLTQKMASLSVDSDRVNEDMAKELNNLQETLNQIQKALEKF